MTLYDLFKKCILANELDNNVRFAYRFSDPDGVRSGKSGWSFGVCQYDINNNPSATLCLRECSFTTDEIAALKEQSIKDMAPFNTRLTEAGTIIDKWDDLQLKECLKVPLSLCEQSGIMFSNDEARLHLADYHNQFYMSRGGKMHQHLAQIKRLVVGSDIMLFKLSLPWGRKRPDDVRRRYENIVNIMKEVTA